MLRLITLCVVQADIFSFGCLMYELLTGAITSQVVVGPTGNVRAAEVYAAQASDVAASQESMPLLIPDTRSANIMSTPFVGWYALGRGHHHSDVAESLVPRGWTGQALKGHVMPKHSYIFTKPFSNVAELHAPAGVPLTVLNPRTA